MLRFEVPSDRIIIEILDNSIGAMIDQIKDITRYSADEEEVKDTGSIRKCNTWRIGRLAGTLGGYGKTIRADEFARAGQDN